LTSHSAVAFLQQTLSQVSQTHGAKRIIAYNARFY